MSYSPSQVFDPALCVVAVQSLPVPAPPPGPQVMLMSRLQGFCATIGSATSNANAQRANGRDMITNIGKYEIKAELGNGAFGRVYRAYDPKVGRHVPVAAYGPKTGSV